MYCMCGRYCHAKNRPMASGWPTLTFFLSVLLSFCSCVFVCTVLVIFIFISQLLPHQEPAAHGRRRLHTAALLPWSCVQRGLCLQPHKYPHTRARRSRAQTLVRPFRLTAARVCVRACVHARAHTTAHAHARTRAHPHTDARKRGRNAPAIAALL